MPFLVRPVILVLLLVGAFFIVNVLILAYRLNISRHLIEENKPYSQNPQNSTYKVLFIGDSTAVGLGSDIPQDSVAGRFGKEHPKAQVESLGKNGYKVGDLIPIFKNLNQQYDLIIIQIGGNDIIRFTNLNEFERDLAKALDLSKTKGKNTVLITTGNVGLAPFFPWPLNLAYTQRSKTVRDIAIKLAGERGIFYVDLFKNKKEDPFAKDPSKYHSKDMLHPSSAGYKLWYEQLMATLEQNMIKIPK